MLRRDARRFEIVESHGRASELPRRIPAERYESGMHRASFKVVVDRPVTTPKDGGSGGGVAGGAGRGRSKLGHRTHLHVTSRMRAQTQR
jgi:hypothetical protein